MTRDEAKKLLPILQAYADGETIQVKRMDEWADIEQPTFAGFDPFYYRIKPKKEENEKLQDLLTEATGIIKAFCEYQTIGFNNRDIEYKTITKLMEKAEAFLEGDKL